jgi:Holliday junction resolvase
MEKNTNLKNIERRIKEIAKDYEVRGFAVTINPNQTNLPDFLKGFEPDIVAISETESVVIEVKSTKGNSSQLKQFESLAQRISEHKNWRFELVFTNPIEQTIQNKFTNELPLEKIRSRISEVTILLISNHYEAAFLLCWTTLEAAIRLKLDSEKNDSNNKPTLAIIKTIYSLGYINSHDYKKLEVLNQKRNLLIHGFDNSIDRNSIEQLINIVTYIIGDSKEVVMNNWLESMDLDEYEDIYELYQTVRYKNDYGSFTFSETDKIIIGCTYIEGKLILEGEDEYQQFLNLIEQEYMDDMDAESWYGFKKAMDKDD